jgi:hypothetical protein
MKQDGYKIRNKAEIHFVSFAVVAPTYRETQQSIGRVGGNAKPYHKNAALLIAFLLVAPFSSKFAEKPIVKFCDWVSNLWIRKRNLAKKD